MGVWSKDDVTGATRAINMLQPCARDVKHGFKADALGRIAGAVACGFVSAATVAKETKIPLAEVEAAAKAYADCHPDLVAGKPKPDPESPRQKLIKAVATEIRKAGGLGTINPTMGANKIVAAVERELAARGQTVVAQDE